MWHNQDFFREFIDNSTRIADLQKIEELQHLALLDPLTSLANPL